MKISSSFAKTLAMAGFIGVAAATTQAVTFTWTTNAYLSGTTNFMTLATGWSKLASFSIGGGQVTFGGETWSAGGGNNNMTASGPNGFSFNFSRPNHYWGSSYNGFDPVSNNVVNIQGSYANPDTGPYCRLQITGFIPGQEYQIQFIVADSRSAQYGRTVTIEPVSSDGNTLLGGNSTAVQYSYNNGNNDAHFAVVTADFVADASSYNFVPWCLDSSSSPTGPQINAIRITTPPAAPILVTWDNGSGSGAWNTTDTNWTGYAWDNSLPNTALISSLPGTTNINLSQNITARDVTWGNVTGSLTNVQTLTVTNSFNVQGNGGNYFPYTNNPTFTLAGPTLNVAGYLGIGRMNLLVGNSTINANLITSAFANGAVGDLIISSGAIVRATNGIDYNVNDQSASSSLELNGGTLYVPSINACDDTTDYAGPGIMKWNGGTLVPTADNANFITVYNANNKSAVSDTFVENGGAVIDTAGHSIGIGVNLLADEGAGGLTKNGNGTLTLSGANTYTGGTTVSGGTLILNNGGQVGCILGALIIDSGATVQLNTADALGWGGGTAVTQINVNGGTLTNNVAGNNGYLASWTLTDGTMSSLAGGAYNIIGGSGTITTLASANPSAINADIDIRGANSILSINAAQGAGATDLLISGVIADSPSEPGDNGITKAGAGTLVLSGANTYTGNTTVSAGTLLVNGSLATGAVNVGAGCYLGGTGIIGGNTTVSNGAVLILGAIGANGTLGFGANLTLAPGATVDFDLSTNNTVDGGANDQIAVSSALTLNGNAFHIKAPGSLVDLDTNSDYVLITAASISGSFASIPVWDVAPANSNNFSVVTSGTTVTLHYSTLTSPTGSGFATPSTAVHNQNVLISVTVTNGSGTVDPNTGVVLNASTIGGSSSVPLVLSGTPNVYTNTITIPAAASYGSYILTATITDSYSDVGTANIPLIVSSTEVWNGLGGDQNWDTGSNWVSTIAPDLTGDDLVFAGNVGTAPNMDNSYSVDSLTFSSNAGSFTIGSTTSSTLTLTGGGITNNSAYAQTLNVPVADAGGGLTKSGNSTVILAATNTYTGNTTINAGVLNVSGAGQLNAGAYAAAIVDNGTFAYSSSASQVLSGAISGTGGMTVNATNGGVLTLGSGAGSLMTYTGPTIVDGGELQLNFANVGNSYGIAASSGLIINNGASVVLMNDNSLAGGNFVVGSVPVTINAGGVLTGSDTVDGGAGSSAHIFGLLTLNGGTLANGGTGAQPQWGTWNLDGGVVVNGGTNTSTMSALDMIPTQAGGTIFSVTNGGTASGVDLNVTGTLINGTSMHDTGIILDGNGTMVLSGANTYAGQTIVSNGTLLVNGSLAAGSAVTVASGALGGVGSIGGATTVNAGGYLVPGINGVGTLTFTNNLTLNAASTNNFVVTANGASNNVAVTGTLTPNGSVIHIAAGTALGLGTNTLFTCGTISGAFNATPVFDVAQNNVGSIVNDGAGHINLVMMTGVNTNPATANFAASVAGSAGSKTLNFTWAPDHQGWQLYTNAVGLTATGSWFPVLGSASVTNESITVDSTKHNVFFQLRYP